jgi:predicted O-methyltransferase YrrM
MKPKTRNELGILFQEHFKTGLGVEVGTAHGFNALKILKHWKGELKCVDIWAWDSDYEIAIKNLGFERCIRKSSVEAITDFKNESLDWVYIDADHSYKSVLNDLIIWRSKVRQGGIISGHDYVNAFNYGVIQAVNEFITVYQYGLYLINQYDDSKDLNFQSYYFFKT